MSSYPKQARKMLRRNDVTAFPRNSELKAYVQAVQIGLSIAAEAVGSVNLDRIWLVAVLVSPQELCRPALY